MGGKGSGGARPNSGHPRTGNQRIRVTLSKSTLAKIDKLRKSGELWKLRGQIIDQWAGGISVDGLEYLDLAMRK